MPGDEKGLVLAHEDLFKAAALEPLLARDGQSVFEPESFTKRLLEISKEHGSA
jgi:hypothetical protein